MLPLLAESWTWYSVAVLIVICRYISRYLQLGSLKSFQIEDYVMIFVLAFYTSLVANMNIIAHLDTNLMMPSDLPTLTEASIKSRVRGSKLVLVVEQSMIMTIWGCKICLLLMYNRLVFGLTQQIAVKILAAYVITNLIVMEILYFGVWCRPFHEYWAVPTDNVQCSAAIHHLITNAVFNISSDVMMLCIPLPLLITSHLPRAKKLILCCLFSLGLFVILCAVLNKYYSFAHPFSPMWTFWYIREASTAIYVANMPMCWALLRRLFHLRAFNSSSLPSQSRNHNASHPHYHHESYIFDANRIGKKEKGKDRGGTTWWEQQANFDTEFREVGLQKSESEERIMKPGKVKMAPLEIWQSREVDVANDRKSALALMGNEDTNNGEGTEFKTITVVEAKAKKSESSSN